MSPADLAREPVYRQIAHFYAEKIRGGDIAPGEKLPSVAQLCQAWRIAKGTAVNVLAVLQQDGLVESSRRGTFAKPTIQ